MITCELTPLEGHKQTLHWRATSRPTLTATCSPEARHVARCVLPNPPSPSTRIDLYCAQPLLCFWSGRTHELAEAERRWSWVLVSSCCKCGRAAGRCGRHEPLH